MRISITMTNNNFRRIGVGFAVTIFWLGVWTLVCLLANQTLLMPLPYPWDVAIALGNLVCRSDFWADVAYSLFRIVLGFVMAVCAGSGLAILTVRLRWLHTLFAPMLSVIRAVPVASFIFLAFLWIAPDAMPTFIAFLMVLPLVWENVRQGIVQTDSQLLEMAQVFRLSRVRRLFAVWFPSVRPYWRAALSTGFGFAWKSGVAAEIICTTGRSIGAQIAASKITLNYAEVFASTVVVVVLSVVLEWLVRRIFRERKVVA